MNTHPLTSTTFTIRTPKKVIAECVGIENALAEVTNLSTTSNVAVFFDGNNGVDATYFTAWAKRMNRLITQGIGFDGAEIA